MVQPRTTYSDLTFSGGGTFQQVKANLTVETAPVTQGRFWALQFSFTGGNGGYFGLQTLGTGLPGKAAVFSIADAVSGTGPGIVTSEFDGAPGVSTRMTYNWQRNRSYRFSMTRGALTGAGREWTTTVTDLTTSTVTTVATITVPAAWGAVDNYVILFGEHYSPTVATCAEIQASAARWESIAAVPLGGGADRVPVSWFNHFDNSSPCTDGAIYAAGSGARHEMGSTATQASALRRVKVLVGPSPSNTPSAVDVTDGSFYAEDDGDVGSFRVSVAATDPNATQLTEGSYVAFRVTADDDTDPDWESAPTDFVGVVERVKVRVRDRDRGNMVREAAGRSVFAELEWFLVQPPLGRLNKPTPLEVRFDWSHPGNRGGIPGRIGVEPERVGLVYPTFQGSVFTADQFIAGGSFPSSPQGRVNAAPEGWPDAFGAWIWTRAVDGNDAHPDGVSYFFGIIETNQLPLIVTWAADNNGQLAVNGAVVDAGASPPASQWKSAAAIGIPEVSVGATYIHARVENRSPYGPNNPGGFAMCAHQPLVNERFVFDNCIARTGNATLQDYVHGDGTGNRTRNRAGGGWKCLDYPASPPGFTVGTAMRWLFQTIETYSAGVGGWTLGFDDVNDSNGNPWDVTDRLTAKVNDSIADVCRQWTAQGQASFAADTLNRVLLAYRWKEQGMYPTSVTTWGDDELAGLSVEAKR